MKFLLISSAQLAQLTKLPILRSSRKNLTVNYVFTVGCGKNILTPIFYGNLKEKNLRDEIFLAAPYFTGFPKGLTIITNSVWSILTLSRRPFYT
jgi:hypothetical protein